MGIPEKKRSTLRACAWAGLSLSYAAVREDETLNVQHREERGDDCAVLCGFRATGKSTVRARGDGDSPNAPPAQDSGVRDVSRSLMRCSIHQDSEENALAKVGRMAGPFP